MTSYHVDSDAVLAHATAARTTVGRIQSETSSLHAQLEQLQGSWSGSAATAFRGVVSEWRAAQQRVDDALTALGGALAQAGRQYAEIEQHNTRLFAS
ncbi:WXG100 family type VII secretion target [Homoserinibacter sp. GY 40078]|uniref:WXG100 family type VII secretion target n=1 Tax=Homoserinibacter sp. GY 40078 TaxID=2603275 RepID=UPI0011C8A44F|nr:WXG100 family type VII secretion target [Homoserinibacter sp. GY 40078]TXK19356.1 WXG100 family type VII secretion target [Homoserinibacter sp. GY 40078]